MSEDTLHYVIVAGVGILIVLAIINLVYTMKQQKKEGYFSGGGPYGATNSGIGAYNTKEGYFSGGGPYGYTNSGNNGAFDSQAH